MVRSSGSSTTCRHPRREAIAALTTVFGVPPVDEAYDGGNHRPDGIHHSWSEFVLDERFHDEERRTDEGYDFLVWPRFAVYFDGPAADGIVLSTVQGRQAGDPWADVAADPQFDATLWTCVGTPIEVLAVPDGTGTISATATVVVVPTDDESAVKWIGAPEMVVEGCA